METSFSYHFEDIIRRLIPPFLKKRLRSLIFRGKNVYCPICEKSFITFLPFGIIPRANVRCPYCNSFERTRLYWLYLKDKKKLINATRRILHVAPEEALFKKFISMAKIEYYPVDKFEKGYSYPKGTINMDITDIGYPNDFFDFILCSHVLEHIPDDILAMKELYRVLKTGGFGILQVPIDLNKEKTFEDFSIVGEMERQKAFGQSDHVRIYGKDYKNRLETAGFSVTIDDYYTKFTETEKFYYGLQNEPLYIVQKINS